MHQQDGSSRLERSSFARIGSIRAFFVQFVSKLFTLSVAPMRPTRPNHKARKLTNENESNPSGSERRRGVRQ